MSIRGKVAIVGVGELPSRRDYPGRSTMSLLAEVGAQAITDAGLRKADIDGLVTSNDNVNSIDLAEYMRIRPQWTGSMTVHGSSGVHSVAMAAAALAAGYCTAVLCVFAGSRETPGAESGAVGGRPSLSLATEWVAPFGDFGPPSSYAIMKSRYMYQFGARDEQFAKIMVDQRVNALANPNAVFQSPLTINDVLESRYVCQPLHLLECVMRAAGGTAAVLTTADRAKSLPHPPVYLLGAGGAATTHMQYWQAPDLVVSPVVKSARGALEIAQYGVRDLQFAELYDNFSIFLPITVEDIGICPKGEGANFYSDTDTTYRGAFPINTDGGQISGGQVVLSAGGFRHVVEATQQIQGRAGQRQVTRHDLCVVNGVGGTASSTATLVLGSESTL